MIRIGAGIATAIAGVAWLLAWRSHPRGAINAYLFAYISVVGVVVGTLLQVMISYLTGSVWFVLFRRYAWMIVATTPLVAVLALPLVLDARDLYPWARDGAPHSPWFVPRWFAVRAVLYVATWAWFALRMLNTARRQDRADAAAMVATTRTLRRLSTVGTIVVGVTLTLAAFDWVMSLDPAWISTVFGVYLFAGGWLAALAVIAIVAALAPPGSTLGASISGDQRWSLGTLMFTAGMFWAYIAFAQFLIIWIGNIPADAGWYAARGHGAWRAEALFALGAQFIVPCAVFLFRGAKRSRQVLLAAGALILVGHLADCYWIVTPALGPGRPGLNWPALAAVIALAGAVLLVGSLHRLRFDSLPGGDPYLDGVLEYQRGRG